MNTIHSLGNARIVLSNLNVDADGSPIAYAPAGSGLPTLDYLADAGRPGNWWGIVTDNGKPNGRPIIQKSTDPAPGYYVSSTSLYDKSKHLGDPTAYPDSSIVPFAVIPSKPNFGIKLGDVGFALNLSSGDSSQFIVADIGPSNTIGEMSVAAAQYLSINPSAKNGGTGSYIILYIFFANSTLLWPQTSGKILESASNQLKSIGGLSYIKSQLPQFNFSKF